LINEYILTTININIHPNVTKKKKSKAGECLIRRMEVIMVNAIMVIPEYKTANFIKVIAFYR